MDLNDARIQTEALAAAQAYLATLPDVSPGLITHCSLHWAATPYGWAKARSDAKEIIPYQVVADVDSNSNAILVPGMSPAVNARDIPPGAVMDVDYCASVYHRNSHGVAVSISAMAGAGPHSFGAAPVTAHLVEYMCAGAAALCAKYSIDASAAQSCFTHAEAAIWDSYFLGDDPDCRWDLSILEASDADVPTLKANAPAVGDRLRARVHAYKLQLMRH